MPACVRRPCSTLIETDTTWVLLDAGLVNLSERFPAGSLDAIVLTHFHPDHVQGLFHLRWGVGKSIPTWAPPDSNGCADLYRNPGLLAFNQAEKSGTFYVGDLRFTALPLIYSKPTFGYAIEGPGGERFAYLTDTIGLPPSTPEWLQGWGAFSLALDCSFPPKAQPAHNDWNTACALVKQLRPVRAWMTHASHTLDAWLLEQSENVMPEGVLIAQDWPSTTGTPSAPLLVLLALALPGPVAAALWWVKGRETRNISLEEGSDDALTEATPQQNFRTREA